MKIDKVQGQWAGGKFMAAIKGAFAYGMSPTVSDLLGHAEVGDLIANLDGPGAVLRLSDGDGIGEEDLVMRSSVSTPAALSKEVVNHLSERHMRDPETLSEVARRVSQKGKWSVDFETFYRGCSLDVRYDGAAVVSGGIDAEGRNYYASCMEGLEVQAAAVMIRMDAMMRSVRAEILAEKASEAESERKLRASALAKAIENDISDLEP